MLVGEVGGGQHSIRLSMMAPVACCPGRYLGTMQVLRVISVSKELEALTLESHDAMSFAQATLLIPLYAQISSPPFPSHPTF